MCLALHHGEFTKAMSHYNDKLNLKLNPSEIKDLFNRADADSDGTISYEEFVRFAGAGKRFIPEFLKPKVMRRSMQVWPGTIHVNTVWSPHQTRHHPIWSFNQRGLYCHWALQLGQPVGLVCGEPERQDHPKGRGVIEYKHSTDVEPAPSPLRQSP
jgi:hypothetical protein